MVELCANPHYG